MEVIAPWDQVDLVLLPLPHDEAGDDEREPVDQHAVVEHLASRRLCAAVVDGERIGVVGAVVVRFAVRGPVVAAVDDDGSVHPGPRLTDVALGLAYRVGAVVHVDDDLVVDSGGRLLDDERVLAGVELSTRSRVVSAWRDDDLLLARMLAAEMAEHGDAHLADGWVVVAWEDGTSLPDLSVALRAGHHPVAQAVRSGDLRTVLVTPSAGADALEVTWAPRLDPVLDAPEGSAARVVLDELTVTVAGDDPDDWPPGVDPVLRPFLTDAQRGAGEDFFAAVARMLWLPTRLAERAESFDAEAPDGSARIGDGTARQLACQHVRTPAPETEAERRLRELPRRTVVRQVVSNLVLAVLFATLALTLDLRFAHWVLWAFAGFAAFNAVSTVWFWRPSQTPVRSADK